MGRKHSSRTVKKASLREAEGIVDGYRIFIEPHERFGYVGNAVEFPTGFGRGKTHEECLKDTKKILTVAVATMLDLGGTPPKPAANQERTAQVNVKLTPWERDMMKRAAVHLGYRGLSELVRAGAMDKVCSVFKGFTSTAL